VLGGLQSTCSYVGADIRDDTLTRFPLNINQHAYLAGKSTDTALHTLVGKIERAI